MLSLNEVVETKLLQHLMNAVRNPFFFFHLMFVQRYVHHLYIETEYVSTSP